MVHEVSPIPPLPLVTLLGRWPLSHPWVGPCMRSWAAIQNTQPLISAVSDGTLTSTLVNESDVAPLLKFDDDGGARVREMLSAYPYLRQMRERDLTWRKLLDAPLLHRTAPHILLIDTDVLVRAPVSISAMAPLVYLREDIPAYQAAPFLPLKEPMVRSFNAGFVLLSPSVIDLDYLEYLVKRFLIQLKNPWWSEQAAWAALAGRLPGARFWSGEDACTLSGFKTRSASQIRNDVVRMRSSPHRCSPEELLALAGTAKVIHLAGMGKKNWGVFQPAEGGTISALRSFPDHPINLGWRLMVALRLALKQLM